MEATSFYLVLAELLLAFFGGILFLYCASTKGRLISGAVFFIALLTLISILLGVLNASDSRWVGIKTAFFICSLYLASKYQRQGLMLLAILAFLGFLLDDVATGELLSKHVGTNANQLMPIPFILIASALLIIKREIKFDIVALFFVVIIELLFALILDARASLISALLVIILASSSRASKVFLKYGSWIPFLYLLISLISYFSMLSNFGLISATPSNIERASLMFAAVSHFFEYPFIGPGMEFDRLAGTAANALGWQLYENNKGVDPHFFFLSFWREGGAILTVLWILAWFYYWSLLKKIVPWVDETRVRIVLGMLAIGVVQFSTTPPSTGKRLLIALIMGIVLSFAYRRPQTKVCHSSDATSSPVNPK